jgi:hypothetical protein
LDKRLVWSDKLKETCTTETALLGRFRILADLHPERRKNQIVLVPSPLWDVIRVRATMPFDVELLLQMAQYEK